jgi:hypothetical protein
MLKKTFLTGLLIVVFLQIGTLWAQRPITWRRHYGATDNDIPTAIATTPNGWRTYMVGYSSSNDGDFANNRGGWDVWVVCLERDGSQVYRVQLGGNSFDEIHDIKALNDGSLWLVGTTQSTNISGHRSLNDAWMVKLTASGAVERQRLINGLGYLEDNDASPLETFFAVDTDADNRVYTAGRTSNILHFRSADTFDTITSGMDAWVCRFNATATSNLSTNRTWRKDAAIYQQYPDTLDILHSFRDIKVLSNNNGYVAVGQGGYYLNLSTEDFIVTRFNNSSQIVWQTTIGSSGQDDAPKVVEARNGRIIMVGNIYDGGGDVTEHLGSADVWVVCLDSATGAIQWDVTYGSVFADLAADVVLMNDSTIAIAGWADRYGAGVATGYDAAIWVVNALDGSPVAEYYYGDAGVDERFRAIAYDANAGDFLVAATNGGLSNTFDAFDGGQDMWVLRLEGINSNYANVVGVQAAKTQASLYLYPNPTEGQVYLNNWTPAMQGGELVVTNVQGQTVLRQTLQRPGFDVAALAPGTYGVQLNTPAGLYTQRLVVIR